MLLLTEFLFENNALEPCSFLNHYVSGLEHDSFSPPLRPCRRQVVILYKCGGVKHVYTITRGAVR